MFEELKLIVDMLRSCVSRFQMYKTEKTREKLILDLLQTYFLMKKCVDEETQLIDDAGAVPIVRTRSMDEELASASLGMGIMQERRQPLKGE